MEDQLESTKQAIQKLVAVWAQKLNVIENF